jgi:large repetitive protein
MWRFKAHHARQAGKMSNIYRLYQRILSFIRSGRGDDPVTLWDPVARRHFSPSKCLEIAVQRQAACAVALMILALVCVTATAQTSHAFPGSTAVGKISQPLSVLVTMTAGGVSTVPVVLTQGVANADFVLTAGGTCVAGASYSAGQQCTAMIVFQPKYPGLRSGAVVIENSNGSFMGAALLAGISIGSLPVLTPGSIDTVAGDADWIYQGDGALAIDSPIFLPTGVVADAAGNVFLSDSQNNRIRRVDGQTGIISTVAGTGTPGYQGDHVLATQTMINMPAGLLLDGAGNLYFADTGNHIVRRVDAVTGMMTTVAGTPGVQGYSGDGASAAQAQLTFPESVGLDEAGDLLIADTGNNVIREVNAITGIIRTVAGTGVAGFNGDNQAATTAQLSSPWSVAVAPDGSIYIADLSNNRVRKVNPAGMISTVAGTGPRGFSGDGGSATAAVLGEPAAVAIDPAGDVYIADSDNNRVREISGSTGLIETICGTASEQFAGDAGAANLASLYGPYALFFDQTGNLFIADMFHNRVRRINALAISLQYATIKVGKISAPQAVLLADDGNADLILTQPTLLNAATDAATTTCKTGADIPSATTCNIGAEFAPTVLGDPVLGSITVNSEAGNTAPVISLSGQVLSITPTSVSLTSSVNPSLLGAAVRFTATVSNGGTALTGTVTFLDGAVQLCSVSVTGSTATCNTSTLALGQDSITASYSGDANNASSLSSVLIQVVKESPVLVLTVGPNPALVTANITLTLTATAPTGIPTGAVSFYDGTTALSAASLSTSGIANYFTSQLSPGTHRLSAQYAGDASNASGVSNVVSEVVLQATTVTTLSSSNVIAPVGSQVTFTAIVASANGPVPEGTVQFNDGGTSLGSIAVGSNGTAVLSLASLAPGTHSIVAVYSGDTDDSTSTSTILTETIQQIATATTLSGSPNPISAGATVALTAAVTAIGSSTNGGVITGNVTFSEGSTSLGTASVDASGHATFSLSTLSAGSHSLIASYAGDTNYAASKSVVLVEVVVSTATSTTLTSTTTTTLAGQTASFTAVVSSVTGTPSGSVTIMDGAVSIGQVPLNAQGVATFSTSTLAVGTHTLTAVYVGNENYSTSTSVALQHTVVLAVPSLTLAGPGAAVDAGETFVMTATLSSNGVAPTGTLTLRNGSATIATQSVAADGTFSFSSLMLGVGTYQLTAVYAGNANNATASSAAVTVIVQLTPTATSLMSSVAPATLGEAVTFTATVSGGSPGPTGSTKFMDGSVVLGSSSVGTNGTAVLTTSTLTFGAHSITASYQGDADHAISSSTALSEQIVEAANASLSSSVNPSIFGTNIIFTAKIAGVGSLIPTGAVIFRDGASTLSTSTLDGTGMATLPSASLAVGSHTISVSYGGDTNYSATSATLTQTVQSATTQIILTTSANPAIYGTPVTFTAAVTGNGGVVATGLVTFTDGSISIGSGLLNSNGVAVLTLSTLAPGTHAIVASYAGDSNISASSSTPQMVSVKQLTSAVLASSANPVMTLSPIVLTATIANSEVGEATGVVTFTDGSAQLGTATVNASGFASLTIPSLSAGNHSLLASYAGDNDNFASASPALTEGVQLRPTTVAITSSATDPGNPQQITLISAVGWTGSVVPTGTVTFTSGTTVLGSSQVDAVGIGTLTVILQAGTESIVATYSGDTSYASSSSLATSISGGIATQFTLQVNPASVTFPSAEHASVNVNLLSLQGFSDTLQLGCLGLPYAATCTFSTPQVNLAANGSATVQLIIDTGTPLGAGATARLERRSFGGVLLCLLPGLLGIGLGARRRRFKASTSLLLLCLFAVTISAVGCSGLHMNGTPPGTYTFKVTASGAGSGATLSQTVTLTVTQ